MIWRYFFSYFRYFILWYQALGENAPEHIHQMFACLVPGFPPRQPSPYQSERRLDSRKDKSTNSSSNDDKEKRDFYDTQLSQSIFHDSNVAHGPISQANGVPILPVQSGEKPLDNETVRFFEALLEFMVTQVREIE